MSDGGLQDDGSLWGSGSAGCGLVLRDRVLCGTTTSRNCPIKHLLTYCTEHQMAQLAAVFIMVECRVSRVPMREIGVVRNVC